MIPHTRVIKANSNFQQLSCSKFWKQDNSIELMLVLHPTLYQNNSGSHVSIKHLQIEKLNNDFPPNNLIIKLSILNVISCLYKIVSRISDVNKYKWKMFTQFHLLCNSILFTGFVFFLFNYLERVSFAYLFALAT